MPRDCRQSVGHLELMVDAIEGERFLYWADQEMSVHSIRRGELCLIGRIRCV